MVEHEQDDSGRTAHTFASLVLAFADVSRSNAEMAAALSAATRDASHGHQSNTRLQFLIGVLVALNVFQFWKGDADKVFTLDHAVTGGTLALDAKTKIAYHELEAEKLWTQQKLFNKTVIETLEEIANARSD